MLKSIGEIGNIDIKNTIFIGELSLDGKINPVNGVLPICLEAKKFGIKTIIVPKENSKEAAVVSGIEIIGINNLRDLINFLNKKVFIEKEETYSSNILDLANNYDIDFDEVKGQESVKRALEIAVSGRT